MKRAMTLKTRFILTSYCSIVISVFLICIVSYVLLGNLSRKFAIQANQEAVRQKNEDISGRVNGIEVTIRDIIYNSELQKLLNERNMEEGQESKDVYGMRMAVNSSIARDLGIAGLLSILFFLLILVLGLAYAWRKGALEWKE